MRFHGFSRHRGEPRASRRGGNRNSTCPLPLSTHINLQPEGFLSPEPDEESWLFLSTSIVRSDMIELLSVIVYRSIMTALRFLGFRLKYYAHRPRLSWTESSPNHSSKGHRSNGQTGIDVFSKNQSIIIHHVINTKVNINSLILPSKSLSLTFLLVPDIRLVLSGERTRFA